MPASYQHSRRAITPEQAYAAGVPAGNPYHAGDGRVLIARAPRLRVRSAGRHWLLYATLVWVQVLRAIKMAGGREHAASADFGPPPRPTVRALPH